MLETNISVKFSPYIHKYPFGDGVILFLEGTRKLWALNSAATFVFNQLASGMLPQDVPEGFSESFEVDRPISENSVRELLASFRAMGLLGDDEYLNDDPLPSSLCLDTNGPEVPAPSRWAAGGRFSGIGEPMEFCSVDLPLGDEFLRLMSADGCVSDTSENIRQLWLVHMVGRPDSLGICLDGRLVLGDVPRDEVLPLLVGVAAELGAFTLDKHFILHAAALCRGESAVVLPAESGSGKTTLSVGLSSRGYWCLSEDLAVLDVHQRRVLPFLHPPSIKDAAVPVLVDYYPELRTAPLSLRRDGKCVRYLPVQKIPEHLREDGAPVRYLVFPRYGADTPTCLSPLDKISALQRLAASSVSGRQLTGEDVQALIDVVEGADCYHLGYCDLGDAMDLIDGLFQQHTKSESGTCLDRDGL